MTSVFIRLRLKAQIITHNRIQQLYYEKRCPMVAALANQPGNMEVVYDVGIAVPLGIGKRGLALRARL